MAGAVTREPIELSGAWLPKARRTYEGKGQPGAGSGPFIDVIDWRWQGELACAVPIAGIVFLVTATECYWSKTTPPASPLTVDVSLHAYADCAPDRATFAASINGAGHAGIAVPFGGDPAAACAIGEARMTSGRVGTIAVTEAASFSVLLLPATCLQIGRSRLWRVRNAVARSFPPRVRELLTRRRSGTFSDR